MRSDRFPSGCPVFLQKVFRGLRQFGGLARIIINIPKRCYGNSTFLGEEYHHAVQPRCEAWLRSKAIPEERQLLAIRSRGLPSIEHCARPASHGIFAFAVEISLV